MSSALKHSQYTGFFPFDWAPYADEAAFGDVGGLLTSSALADLVQLFWSAKDAVISYDLNYSSTTTGVFGGLYPFSTTTSSTMSGTFRATADTANYAGSLMALPPAARLKNNTPLIYTDGTYLSPNNLGPSYSQTIAETYTGTGHPPDSSESDGPIFDNPILSYFGMLNTQPYGGRGNVAYDPAAAKYYTRLFIEGIPLGDSSTSSTGGYGLVPVNGASIAVQNKGRTIFPTTAFPLYCATYGGSPTITMGGSIVINFDTFWT